MLGRRPPWSPNEGAYQARRLAWFKANGAIFRPVSGYRTQSGKAKWRVWADPIDGHGACELSDAEGKCRLFNSFEAAKRAADAVNDLT